MSEISERRIRQIICEELDARGVKVRPKLIERMRAPTIKSIVIGSVKDSMANGDFDAVMGGRFGVNRKYGHR